MSSSPHHRPDLLRDSATSLASSCGFFGVSYATSVVFARILSAADFGDYAIGMTTISLGSMVALVGSGHAMTRYLPDYLANGDHARLSGYVRLFLPLVIALALLIGVGVWTVREVAVALSLSADANTLHPISVAAWVIGIYALAVFGNRLLRGLGYLQTTFIPTKLLAPVFSLALVVGLHVSGIEVTDWLVLAAVGAGFALAILFEIVVLVVAGHHRLLGHEPRFETRMWLGTALSMMVAGLLSEVLHHGDLVMLEILGETEELVGHYAAINNTVVVLSLIVGAITIVVAPLLGAAIGRHEPAETQALLGQATGLAMLGCGIGTVAIIVFRRPLLGMFGPGYSEAAGALTIAAVAYGSSAAFGLGRVYLMYLDHQRAALWPMAGGVALNLALNAALIPRLGIEGAALATLASLVAIRAVQVSLLYRTTGLVALPFFTRLSRRALRLGVLEERGA